MNDVYILIIDNNRWIENIVYEHIIRVLFIYDVNINFMHFE